MRRILIKCGGVLFVALGLFLIIVQPFSTVTGAVIDVSSFFNKVYFIIGFIIIVFGIILSTLETSVSPTIERTKKFEKSIKGKNIEAINIAITKL